MTIETSRSGIVIPRAGGEADKERKRAASLRFGGTS